MKKRILIPAVIGIAACAVFIGCHSDKPKETQTTLIDIKSSNASSRVNIVLRHLFLFFLSESLR